MEKPDEVSNVGRTIKVLSFEEKTKGIFKQKDEEIQKLKEENERLNGIIARLQEQKPKKEHKIKPVKKPERPLNEVLELHINKMIKEGKVSYAVIKNKTEKYLLPSEKTTLEFILQRTVKIKTGFNFIGYSDFLTGILSGHEEFVKPVNLGETALRIAIKNLEDKELILRHRFNNKSYLYLLNIPKCKEIYELVKDGNLSFRDCEQLDNLIRWKKKKFFELDPIKDLGLTLRVSESNTKSITLCDHQCQKVIPGVSESVTPPILETIENKDSQDVDVCTNQKQMIINLKETTYIGDPILNSENLEPVEGELEEDVDAFSETWEEEQEEEPEILSESLMRRKMFKMLLENEVWKEDAYKIISDPEYLGRVEAQIKALPYRKAKIKGKVLSDSIIKNWDMPKEFKELEERKRNEAYNHAKNNINRLSTIIGCKDNNFEDMKRYVGRYKEAYIDFNEQLEFYYKNEIVIQTQLKRIEVEEINLPENQDKLSRFALIRATKDRNASINTLNKVLKFLKITDDPNKENIDEIICLIMSKVSHYFSLISK